METGMIATLVIGSLLTTGAVAGVAMNGDMMQGMHIGDTHHGMHDPEECEEHMEEWEHEYCEEHIEEWTEHSFEDDHDDYDHCGM